MASEPQLTLQVKPSAESPALIPPEPPELAPPMDVPTALGPLTNGDAARSGHAADASAEVTVGHASSDRLYDVGSADVIDRAPSSMPVLEDVEELPTVNLAGDPLPAFGARRGLPAGFTLTELWGEADRDAAREAEGALAARDVARAVLLCDMLVTRVLASAAGLLGSADAPRDPGSVVLLLGLDGRRYLGFRAVVRAVRQSEDVHPRDALECYAFALEARRARELIGR
jgi:hypothetical protein